MQKSQRNRRAILILAMLLSMASVVFGQTDTTQRVQFYVGPFLGGGRAWDLADLRIVEFAACDSSFRIGSGWMVNGGGLVELFPASSWSLQLRLGLALYSGQLDVRITGENLRDQTTGDLIPSVVDQLLEYRHSDLFLSGLAIIPVLTNRVRFIGGVELARPISSTQVRKQQAVSPETLLIDNVRVLTLRSGELLTPSPLTVSLGAGIAYDLPNVSHVVPSLELTAWGPLNSQVSDGPWRTISLRLGASVRFGVMSSPPVVQPPPDTPHPVVVLPPDLHPRISTHPPEVIVQIDEYDSTEALPLLNQVFFANGSDSLRNAYHNLTSAEAQEFSLSQLTGSALEVYYDILNIIGARMREMSEATLTINGYQNARETDRQLASRRARAIRDYLVDVWGIPVRRLKLGGGGLPPNPSRVNSDEGDQENARVELMASDPNVTRPLIRKHIQRTATPPAIIFLPRVDTTAPLAKWSLTVFDDNAASESRRWKQFSGEGPLRDSIVWDWRNDDGKLPELPMRLGYALAVSPDMASPWQHSDTHSIVVNYDSAQHRLEHRENDTTIQTYSLLLFNYDSPKISASDQLLLRAIASTINKGAVITIIGFTDSLGEESHNRELANKRAEETAKILRKLVIENVTVNVSEEGGERERFPYNTPEGRSHCRTVVIEVRTPVSSHGS